MKEITFRLNRCLVRYSRRQSDELIAKGRVIINHHRIGVLGDQLKKADVITINGKQVNWQKYHETSFESSLQNVHKTKEASSFLPSNDKHVYLKLWKEKNVVCTTSRNDPLNIIERYRLNSCFPSSIRLFPVGRLDKSSTGLILLTSDPSFQHLLLHHRKEKEKVAIETGKAQNFLFSLNDNLQKIYQVGFDSPIPKHILSQWERGVQLQIPFGNGRKIEKRQVNDQIDNEKESIVITTQPCKVVPIKVSTITSLQKTGHLYFYEFHLIEGKNRQIHRMASLYDFEVKSLHRISFCGITLSGLTSPGKWKHLTSDEMNLLRSSFLSSR
jgi:pseudouridine synthase